MPGLLQAEGRASAKLAAAIAAEFFGTLMFALIGAAAPAKKAAVANGLAFAVLIYATANVSGGHLNPAVTTATIVTGHVSIVRGAAYILAQCAGAITASALHLVLIPHAANVGCFGPAGGATLGMAFGWELLLTAALVAVVYATAVGDKNVAGPAAIGITLTAAALAAGPLTGAALNPARALGPATVFGCGGVKGAPSAAITVAVYVAAEVLGALAAALGSWPLYGAGPFFGKWRDARAEAEGALSDAKEALRGTYARLEDDA